jgi:hypothetical protein
LRQFLAGADHPLCGAASRRHDVTGNTPTVQDRVIIWDHNQHQGRTLTTATRPQAPT